MEERHVTRAGARLFLSQPAASQRLARLREFFGDPLLVKVGKDLQPTSRAEALYASILPALRALEATVAAEMLFDAASDGRTFRLGASDLAAMVVLPSLLARLRRDAPRCRLVLREGDHKKLPAMVANGEVPTVLGYLDDGLPGSARQRALGRMDWVVVRDASSPKISSLDDFCAVPMPW